MMPSISQNRTHDCSELEQGAALLACFGEKQGELHLNRTELAILVYLITRWLVGRSLTLRVADFMDAAGKSERCIQFNLKRLREPKYAKPQIDPETGIEQPRELLRPALITRVEQSREDGGSAPNLYLLDLALSYLAMYAVPVQPAPVEKPLSPPLPVQPAPVPETSSSALPVSIKHQVMSISQEFGEGKDQQRRANVSRVSELYESTPIDEQAFLACIAQARQKTKQRSQSIKSGKGMAYFFTCLGNALKDARLSVDQARDAPVEVESPPPAADQIVESRPAPRVSHDWPHVLLRLGEQLDYPDVQKATGSDIYPEHIWSGHDAWARFARNATAEICRRAAAHIARLNGVPLPEEALV